MSDRQSLAQTTFEGCAANVGPLIGLELEVGEASVETSAEIPEGAKLMDQERAYTSPIWYTPGN